jgi:hypothetical protein
VRIATRVVILITAVSLDLPAPDACAPKPHALNHFRGHIRRARGGSSLAIAAIGPDTAPPVTVA